ncbi:transposase family protein [Streptomyces sp. NPDC057101]|uniref:helix-turn-helix domain-containing protein n=1 Tax=Streptomyces sp. NPDC057101 TaxID=3346020 RepID=UPI003629B96D
MASRPGVVPARAARRGPQEGTPGAGPKQRLAFTDRLLVTLVHLRLGLPHAALAELYSVDRATVSRESTRSWPPSASPDPTAPACDCAPREDLFADAEGVRLRIDGTKSRSAAHARAAPAAKRSCRARSIRTPSRPQP